MELNHECVRDLLLAIEKHGTMEALFHEKIMKLPELKNYDENTIVYTAQRLNEAGYINGNFDFYMDLEAYIAISSLTYNGHNFLDTIRDNTVWSKTKETASKVTSVSLPVLFEIGTSILKSKLGL